MRAYVQESTGWEREKREDTDVNATPDSLNILEGRIRHRKKTIVDENSLQRIR